MYANSVSIPSVLNCYNLNTGACDKQKRGSVNVDEVERIFPLIRTTRWKVPSRPMSSVGNNFVFTIETSGLTVAVGSLVVEPVDEYEIWQKLLKLSTPQSGIVRLSPPAKRPWVAYSVVPKAVFAGNDTRWIEPFAANLGWALLDEFGLPIC